MLVKLPKNLDDDIRIIAHTEQIAIPLIDIRKLLIIGFITYKSGGGWMINCKVREYLSCYMKYGQYSFSKLIYIYFLCAVTNRY